jgi:hypothetical protein
MYFLENLKINEFKVVIFLIVFVHSILTTFRSTIACKHPTQKPFLVHSSLPCFILTLPYYAQILLKSLNIIQRGTSNTCGLDHTILVPPPNELGDVS